MYFQKVKFFLQNEVEAFNFNQDSKIKVYSTGLVAHKQIKSKSAGKTDNNKKVQSDGAQVTSRYLNFTSHIPIIVCKYILKR